jgi:hypothetical protein
MILASTLNYCVIKCWYSNFLLWLKYTSRIWPHIPPFLKKKNEHSRIPFHCQKLTSLKRSHVMYYVFVHRMLIFQGHSFRYKYILTSNKSCCTWFQDEALNVPEPVNQLLTDYAKRFHEIKTPRKLLWKKNLGTVKVRCFKISIQFSIFLHHMIYYNALFHFIFFLVLGFAVLVGVAIWR